MIGAVFGMRDLLRDFEWFAHREQEFAAALARGDERFAAGKFAPERKAIAEASQFGGRYQQTVLRYSAGVALEALAPEVRWWLDRVDGRPLGTLAAGRMAALGLLFGVVDGDGEVREIFSGEQNLYETEAPYHRVTDWVLGVESRPVPYAENEKGPVSLLHVIETAESGDARNAFFALNEFVTGTWLFELRDGVPLDPQHPKYRGEWCWEGALAAVRYDIDDSALVGTAHWPSDLVAAARAGTVFPRTSDRDYDAPMLRDWAAS